MWILYAVGSAFFAGVTSVLAKSGIKKTDSNIATAIRTVVFSYFVFGERLTKKEGAGLFLLTAGTVAMALI